MVLVRPEEGIGNEEVGDAWPPIIVNQGSPMGMRPLPGIRMLIDAGSVKGRHAVSVPGEMGRHPVKNHADSLLVHVVHKCHEIIRCAVPAGGRIVARDLIAPGAVQRMLHHRHQLHMGVAHLLHIGSQPLGGLPVVVELGACDGLPRLVHCQLLADPGAQVHLVDVHGLVLGVRFSPLLHPRLVLPLIAVNVPDHGGGIGPKLRIVGIGIRLQHGLPVPRLDLILVDIPLLEARNKQLENAGVVPAHLPHLMAPPIPLVEIANHADPHGAGRPHGKIHALHPVNGHGMRAHFLIYIVVNARSEFLNVLVCIQRRKGVGVTKLLLSAALKGNQQRIRCHGLSRNQHGKKACLVRQLHRIFLSISRKLHGNGLRSWDKGLNKEAILCHVRSQQPMGIGGLRIHQLLNPCPIHLIVQFLFHPSVPLL